MNLWERYHYIMDYCKMDSAPLEAVKMLTTLKIVSEKESEKLHNIYKNYVRGSEKSSLDKNFILFVNILYNIVKNQQNETH